MIRSEVRHALYRISKGIPDERKQNIYDLVEPNIPTNESWATFSKGWDVLVKDDSIVVIRPEVDYDYIHSTCLEMAFAAKKNTEVILNNRQLNIVTIVELSMLEGKMKWETYNKDWGVSLDVDLKRINTKLFSTNVNEVTEEMIKNSSKSDGFPMMEVPSIPGVNVDMSSASPQPMSPAEEKMFKKFMKNKKFK